MDSKPDTRAGLLRLVRERVGAISVLSRIAVGLLIAGILTVSPGSGRSCLLQVESSSLGGWPAVSC